MNLNSVTCQYAGLCSGCDWIQRSYEDQKNEKSKRLGEGVDFVKIAPGGLRDRVDLTFQKNQGQVRLGFYGLNDRERILDIESCPAMSKDLQKWYEDFRKEMPNVEIGSVRLRVSPKGVRGVWLDLPNVKVKELLDDKKYLLGLLQKSIVEIGQKRKILVKVGEDLKLKDAVAHPWFQTFVGSEMRPVDLFCSVGGFTQTGFAANRVLVEEVLKIAKEINAGGWLELCSGIGNFTIPLASVSEKVEAVESDERANEAAEKSLLSVGVSVDLPAGMYKKVKVSCVNIHKPSEKMKELILGCDAIFADPPRSGLMGFLDVMKSVGEASLPTHFLYVSCFAESLLKDILELQNLGYQVVTKKAVDQFPQSSHCEYVVWLKIC